MEERRNNMETVKFSGNDNGYLRNITVYTNNAECIKDNIKWRIFDRIVESVIMWNDRECKYWTTDKKIDDNVWVENIIWEGQPAVDEFNYTCTVLFPDDYSPVYTMSDWSKDGSFHAEEHQEIEEEIFYEFYNDMPPMTLPLDNRIVRDYPNAEWGFMDSEPYGVSKNHKMTYGTFLKTTNGRYYFLGNLAKDLSNYGSI